MRPRSGQMRPCSGHRKAKSHGMPVSWMASFSQFLNEYLRVSVEFTKKIHQALLTPAPSNKTSYTDKTPSFTNTYSDTGRDTATSGDGGQPPTIAEFSSIVEENMLKLWSETKDACPLDSNSRKINVLMFTKTMYDATDDPLISFKLPGELRMSSGARPIHNLHSQGRQQLQISILAACFLSL
ncbi:hypothetical protein ElyMa_006823400 [Elysia marginata]|uniref:Uncharacterized protein n=1 Tax=Elysia marginata TaxID=1093978 RepID=A0AAV4J7N6_9GAST|nr:hypothetical protein ElyMa_006823400 [Elysia marginata]